VKEIEKEVQKPNQMVYSSNGLDTSITNQDLLSNGVLCFNLRTFIWNYYEKTPKTASPQ